MARGTLGRSIPVSLCFLAAMHLVRAPYAGESTLAPSSYTDRWLYCSVNLQVDQSVNDLEALFSRASRAGYTGILLADYKLQVLYRVTDNYFRNVEKVKAAATKAKLELVPAVFSIGYSNGHLAQDPNLAEGLPVIDQPYVEKGSSAVLVPDPAAKLKNGNLEESRGDKLASFGLQDDPGLTMFVDRAVFHQGRASCRVEPGAGGKQRSTTNTRLAQSVRLRPHTAYRLSCWIKTRDLAPTGGFHLLALGSKPGGRQLTFHEGGLESTEDWKKLDVVFNSLDQTEANLYVGFWGEGKGTFWIDDIQLEELALVNVLRRKGCPLSIKSSDGKTTYEEGRDYSSIVDPKLGRVPWEGEFEFDHAGPAITIKPGSRIKAGARLRVSWYHPVITHGSQLMCCLSEPKLMQILRDQAKRVNELFHPNTFFMSHDEIRVMNWCQACQQRGLTPGALLADNVRQCTAILKSVNPRARIFVWSDMFDPHHNAVDQYYLVNGTLKGSWDGLSKDVIIANWNSGKAAESLKFFAGRGHRQLIAGYYDGDDLTNFRDWDTAATGISGVTGFMYTTWQHKYHLLEQYGEAMRRTGQH
jgi:hypothetical protein